MRSRPWVRAAGWLLLLVPFLHLQALFDDPPGTTWLLAPYEWLLGMFVFGSIAWLVSRTFPEAVERMTRGLDAGLGRPGDRTFRLAALGALAAILFLTSRFAFSHRPLLIDSIIQLFQAKIFASGAAWAPAPPYDGFFTTQHMIVDAGRWYSQYPPGHPAALAVGVWLGAPWLVPIVFTLASAWLIGDAARRMFDERVARTTWVLLILAPFFWFMGASHMNHVSSLLFVSLFFWSFVRWEKGGAVRTSDPPDLEGVEPGPAGIAWLALAGAALGGAFLSRPLTAVAVGLAFIVPAVRIAGRRWWMAGLAGAAGFLAIASLYFAFNAATTGDPLTPGYMKLWGAEHGLGFHATPWGDVHTPLTGLRNELIDLGLLHSFLFEWAIPALLPLGLLLAAGWATRGPEARLLGAFFAIPAAYFFYWHRDAFLGPRYLYEGLPFLMPLVAISLLDLRGRLSGRRFRALGELDPGTAFAALVGLSFAYSLLYGTPQRFRVYATGMESVKRDIVEEAREAGVDRGLVFIAVSWGNRLIARARQAGASAGIVERVYRNSDHCELELLVRRAEKEAWPPGRLEREMLSIQRPADEIEVVRLNDDPTLRLVPDRPLAPVCADEVLYDREGYTNYSPHLARNRPDLEGRYVFARDLREQNERLREWYPDRPAWLYRDGRFLPMP